jgi:hypothetical protein
MILACCSTAPCAATVRPPGTRSGGHRTAKPCGMSNSASAHVIVPAVRGGATVMDDVFGDDGSGADPAVLPSPHRTLPRLRRNRPDIISPWSRCQPTQPYVVRLR